MSSPGNLGRRRDELDDARRSVLDVGRYAQREEGVHLVEVDLGFQVLQVDLRGDIPS